MNTVKVLLLLLLTVGFVGCSTSFKEDHYFQALSPKTGDVTNYYRLRVDGYAYFSSARYVSGYYDERAVDMFFNEVKIAPTPSGSTGSQKLFMDNQNNPGVSDKIIPLSPSDQHGAFVMILSNNASSVTNTIGQFAESQVVAEAVTNLTNRDLLRSNTTGQKEEIDKANATKQEIESLVDLVPDGATPPADETSRAYLRILNAIAAAIDSGSPTIANFDEAQDWLSKQKGE